MTKLQKKTVLVLNRNWQVVNTTSPEDAFCQMTRDVARALDIEGKEWLNPTDWEDWQKLAVRECDESVGTVRGEIRIPTVIVARNFTQMPMKRPKFGRRGIYKRDGGVCQYTGKPLKPGEGNIDHIVPKSRGGGTTWENCVLSDKKVNTVKADKTPEEAGLSLTRKPRSPQQLPACTTIHNVHEIADWDIFLG